MPDHVKRMPRGECIEDDGPLHEGARKLLIEELERRQRNLQETRKLREMLRKLQEDS